MRNNTSNSSKYYSNEWKHFFETIVPNTLQLSFATERLALHTYALQNSKHYTTILSVTTPLSRSIGAQERAPMLLPFCSFTSFPMAEQEDCYYSAGSEATVTKSVGDSTMLTISSARLQTFQTWQKFHRSGDNLPISHGHDVLMFLFSMIQGEDADQLCRCGRHGHPRIREK